MAKTIAFLINLSFLIWAPMSLADQNTSPEAQLNAEDFLTNDAIPLPDPTPYPDPNRLEKWKDWKRIKARGCVPDRKYCDQCYKENICDAACYFLPVCGQRP